MGQYSKYSEHVDSYVSYILSSDLQGAKKLVSHLMARYKPASLYIDLFFPAQRKLGELWEQGTITITEEHIATQLSLRLLSLVRDKIRPKSPNSLQVLIAADQHEKHLFCAQVLADLFMFEGWTVFFPGQATPNADLLSYVKKNQLDVLILSVTLQPKKTFFQLLKEAKISSPRTKIIIGGKASKSIKANEIDCVIDDISCVVQNAYMLVKKPSEPEANITNILRSVGTKIATERKNYGLTQIELAKQSKIDRAFLSALENGNKNVSLAVLNRIAVSLNQPISFFLD